MAGRKWTKAARREHGRKMRAVFAARRVKTQREDTPHEEQQEAYIDFAHGYIRGWLDSFASRLGVSGSDLAHRVGALLQARASRR